MYIAFVIDVFSRQLVGWRAYITMWTILLLDALEQRLHGRLLDGDLVVHSDRRPRQFSTRCAGHLAAGAPPSIASVGAAQYDALAKTVIGHFKAEVLHRDGPW